MAKTSRNFRLDDDVFAAAKQRAWHDRRTITDVVEAALREYGASSPATQPEQARRTRPDAPGRSAGCPHPKARVTKGLCGACGTHVG